MGGYKRIIYTKKCSFYDEDLNTINEEDDEDENTDIYEDFFQNIIQHRTRTRTRT